MKLSEEQEQKLVVEYLDILQTQRKVVMFTAVPQNVNNVRFAMRNKRLGVRPGFPDLIIVTPSKTFCIEMKTKDTYPDRNQKDWAFALSKSGVPCYLAHGYNEAKRLIEENL